MLKKVMHNMALFLVFSLILSATAFAMESRASVRIKRYSADLSAGDDGKLYILFSVTASSTMDVIGASKIDIQQNNDSRWVTECTLTVKDTPAMQTSNATRYSASIPYEPDYPNADYRAVVTFYAEDSSGSSTAQTVAK